MPQLCPFQAVVKRMRETTTPEPVAPRKLFAPRVIMEEMTVFYEFLAKGIDAEDISYFNKSYQNLLTQDNLQVCFILIDF